MRSFRPCVVYGGATLPLKSCAVAMRISPDHPAACHVPPRPFTPATLYARAACVSATSPFLSGKRWIGTVKTPTSSPTPPPPPQAKTTTAKDSTSTTNFARLSTAAEATAELQRWIDSLAHGTASSTKLVLSGKSLVACVAALQLQEAQSATTAAASPVQQYQAALARHVYTQCNAAGKPRAAWQLFEDVERNVLCAETLHTSVHYLQHNAFRATPHGAPRSSEGEGQTAAAPDNYEARCAARDLELTFEAIEVLLAGWQISGIHRAAAADGEVASPSTTAAMVPPAESAAFYIGTIMHLLKEPLSGCEAQMQPSAAPSPFLTLPPVKQQFWAQSAQQLTTVLYLALLVTNANTTDAQLVNQAFRDTVRKVYGVPTDRFGVVRSLHYMFTVVLPYVARSFATILDVVRAQQAQAAREATAAAKAQVPPSRSAETKLTASTAKATTTSHTGTGEQNTAGGSGGSFGLSSDRVNKITLVVVCLAAVLYIASSNQELLSTGAAETAQAGELHETYQKLSAMATSATAPPQFQQESPKTLVDALPKK